MKVEQSNNRHDATLECMIVIEPELPPVYALDEERVILNYFYICKDKDDFRIPYQSVD